MDVISTITFHSLFRLKQTMEFTFAKFDLHFFGQSTLILVVFFHGSVDLNFR